MAIEFVDRVPTYVNRMRITPESGGAVYYAKVERADEPVNAGTPLSAATFNQLQEDVGIMTYTHSKSGTVHNFVGTGSNGKAYITAAFAAGDTFAVNGVAVDGAFCGQDAADGSVMVSGRWVTFTYDAERNTLNFKGGGGVTNTQLSGATATAGDVLSNKTFYAGNRERKTGTLPVYSGQYIDANSISLGDNLGFTINRGGYTNNNTIYVRKSLTEVAEAIKLTEDKLVNGKTVLGVTGTGTTHPVMVAAMWVTQDGYDTNSATVLYADGECFSGEDTHTLTCKVAGDYKVYSMGSVRDTTVVQSGFLSDVSATNNITHAKVLSIAKNATASATVANSRQNANGSGGYGWFIFKY